MRIGVNMQLYKVNAPFAGHKNIVKKAYDITNVNPSQYRSTIERYVWDKFPFLSDGMGTVNFKKIDADSRDAVGTITYKRGNVEFVIPIIVDGGELKEPDIAIYNDKVIPIDRGYMEWEIEHSNDPGEGVGYTDATSEMDNLTPQSGLFEGGENYVNKSAEYVIIGKILHEDKKTPYHYKGTILKLAHDGTLSTQDIYGNAEDMAKYKEHPLRKQAKDADTPSAAKYLADDPRVQEMPIVKEISEPGAYSNVLMGGVIVPAVVTNDLFMIERTGKSGNAYVVQDMTTTGHSSPCCAPDDNTAPKNWEAQKWGFGKVYGSGFIGSWSSTLYDIAKKVNLSDLIGIQGKLIMFQREKKDKAKGSSGFIGTITETSIPYYVERVESVMVGAKGLPLTAIHVKSIEDNNAYLFIITEEVGTPVLVNKQKLRGSQLRFLDSYKDVYLVPATYDIREIIGNRVKLNPVDEDYRSIIRSIAKDYPGVMTVEMKDIDNYSIKTADDKTGVNVYKNVSKDGADLLLNYYAGLPFGQNIKTASQYNYRPSDKITWDYGKVTFLGNYKGEFRKLATWINEKASEPMRKMADIETAVNDMIGLEQIEDNGTGEERGIILQMNKVIHDVGQMLLYARIGKIDMSEPILSKAMNALTKLINEMRGTNSNV
jgi:hypothetical protein